MTRLALLVVTLALAAPAATARASSVPGYYGCSLRAKPAVRPTGIVVACADAGFEILHLHWSSWTATAAHAKGTAWVNDCKPYCAAGHFHSYPATVGLSRARKCKNGTHAFTKLSWTYTGKRPKGVARQGSEIYSC